MSRSLDRVSYKALMAEVNRRQRSVVALESKRDKLLKQLRDLETVIRSIRGKNASSPRATAGKRPKNSMTLTQALEKVLANKTMSVTDAAQSVQAAGYKTSSNSFRTQVNIALINSGKFKRVGRGTYTVK